MSKYTDLIKKFFSEEGFYNHLRSGPVIPLPDAPMLHGFKPVYHMYGVGEGDRIKGWFIYKAEPKCWFFGGKHSHDQNLPIKFDGYGISVNLHAWDTAMKKYKTPMVYFGDQVTGGKFYIAYFEELMKWDANRAVSTLGEKCLDVSIKAFKRLDIPELKRYYGL